MKSYKIKKVNFDNKKKLITIEIAKGIFSLPYTKLTNKPKSRNLVSEVYIDKELANQAVTFILQDGSMDSIPVDAFLDFNKDPDFIRETKLHNLTVLAVELVDESGISKREICRRMQTSMSQLSRVLDTSNYSKTFDQLIKLFTVLGADVKVEVGKVA